jgi:hypothetical protein
MRYSKKPLFLELPAVSPWLTIAAGIASFSDGIPEVFERVRIAVNADILGRWPLHPHNRASA